MLTKKGDLLGHYRIIRPLGRGGEGHVFLGMHIRTEQTWALKLIPQSTANGIHEMEIMKRLSHPSLPKIIDIFGQGQWIVLVMEYISGRSLEECICKDRRLTAQQTMDAAQQLCSVLVYLHGRKRPIFHLDLKPSNLILSPDGRLYLTDFGSSLTQDEAKGGVRKGTAGYAAPEQFDPSCPLDEKADLYGFGAVLYRLISGKHYSPLMMGSRIPGCSEGLERIIKRCLDPDPEKRWKNASELQEQLRRIDRRRQRERKRIRIWAVLWLSLAAGCAAWVGLRRQFLEPAVREREYQAVLEEAMCAPEGELLSLCREAVFMEPSKKDGWLFYLSWKDRDGVLTAEEDREVRTLLHSMPIGTDVTYEELLSVNPSAYAEVACRLGIIYWYDYPGADARRIAQGWFRKTLDACSRTDERHKPEWVRIAEVYSHIGTYYDSFSAGDGSRNGEDSAAAFWEDTGRLLEEDLSSCLDAEKILLLYQSCASRLLLDAGKLCGSRIPAEKLQERTRLLEQLTKKLLDENPDLSGSGDALQLQKTLSAAMEETDSLD